MESTKIITQSSQVYTNPSMAVRNTPAALSGAVTGNIALGVSGASTINFVGVQSKKARLGENLFSKIKFQETASLSPETKEKIQKDMIEHYSLAVKAAESIIGEIASEHPDAKEAADLLVSRVWEIVKAYVEVTMLKGQIIHLYDVEYLALKLVAENCAGGSEDTGAVGKNNPLAIKKVIKQGTLREKMTFMYRANEVLLPKIFADAKTVAEINKKLTGFQINENLLNQERADGFFRLCPLVQGFRDRNERINIEKQTDEHAPPKKIKEIKNLTFRELRIMVNPLLLERDFETAKKEHGEKVVTWIPGRNWFKVSPDSEFAKEAKRLGNVPILSGPSGTTDRFLHGADYLGFSQLEKEKVLMALIGWMIPAEDHSFHEIRAAAAEYQIPYNKGPEVFDEFNKQTQGKLQEKLGDKGHHMPGDYLVYPLKKN